MTKMNRLATTLKNLREKNRKALVTYIVAGDPRPELTLPAMHALVSGGADIIELGIPFSDPMAEGPVIQLGHERALANHTSLRSTLDMVRDFRRENAKTPVVVMGYANPVERMGHKKFAASAQEVGVDGIITVDLPPEELAGFGEILGAHNIENIFLLAPTTSTERIKHITAKAGGFLYYVSLKGVTGAGHVDVEEVTAKLGEIKNYSELPVLVGFGIKNAETAGAIGRVADGVVVGSVLVQEMSQGTADVREKDICQRLEKIVFSIRQGLDG